MRDKINSPSAVACEALPAAGWRARPSQRVPLGCWGHGEPLARRPPSPTRDSALPQGPPRQPKGDLKGQILRPHLFTLHLEWDMLTSRSTLSTSTNSPQASRPRELHTDCVCSPSHQGCVLNSTKIKLSAVLFPILRLLLLKCHYILRADPLFFVPLAL